MRGQGRLIFDSARTNATVGVRSGFACERTLCFRSGELSVDLMVSTAGALRTIHGQVIHEASGRPVTCATVRVGDCTEPVSTDEHGEFTTSSLTSAGVQFLWIHTPEGQVLCGIPEAR